MQTTVWTGRGFNPQEGTLSLSDGKLRFEIDGKVIFDETVPQLKITWPWYGFGCQFWARTLDEKYFISFMPTGNTLSTWWEGIQRGRTWKRAIDAAQTE